MLHRSLPFTQVFTGISIIEFRPTDNIRPTASECNYPVGFWLLSASSAGEYEASLIAEFDKLLPEKPPWK
jgi:hypothetical protein